MANKSIFVTGGSGFVGSAVMDELLRRGHSVKALVRNRQIEKPGVENIRGGLTDAAALDSGLAGVDAVVHLVGIIRESGDQTFEKVHVDGTRAILDRAKAAGVRQFVHMSALGAKPQSGSQYLTTKFAAEGLVKQSGLNWTIFRPSVIFGPNGEFVKVVADFARGKAFPYAFMPYFGTGLVGYTPRKLQPVDVADVARAFADAVDRPADFAEQTVDLVGSQVVDWRQLYQVIGEAVTPNPKPMVGLPVWYAKMLTSFLPAGWLPFNKSQAVMASEDNISDVAETERQLGWQPKPFASAFREYARNGLPI